MSYGKIDPKLEAAHVSREEILARLDKLEAEIDVARTALLDRAQEVRIIKIAGTDQAVCVGGRFDGWLMHKHHDGQWITLRKLEQEYPRGFYIGKSEQKVERVIKWLWITPLT